MFLFSDRTDVFLVVGDDGSRNRNCNCNRSRSTVLVVVAEKACNGVRYRLL